LANERNHTWVCCGVWLLSGVSVGVVSMNPESLKNIAKFTWVMSVWGMLCYAVFWLGRSAWWVALALLLTTGGCAHAPAELERIHREVGERIEYQHYAKKDWRIVPEGTEATGNCAVFAMTYKWEALRAGYKPDVVLCRLPDGTGHAYTRVGKWVLDNRYGWVIPITEQECK